MSSVMGSWYSKQWRAANSRWRRRWAILGLLLAALSPLIAASFGGEEPLPRVDCGDGYAAFIYAKGLAGPDGLAWGPDGLLYVAEEATGQITQLQSDGSAIPFMTGLASPEGIAFNSEGELFVVEDVENGRLMRRTVDGAERVLASGLDAPEGVATDGTGAVYFTESNVQFTPNPFDFRSRVSKWERLGGVKLLLESSLIWSYSGITVGADGQLYVANEAAGTSPTAAVVALDPAGGAATPVVTGPVAAEGLRFFGNGAFPLYVVEEDLGAGNGRLSRVTANGAFAPTCTGLLNVEDVVVGADGAFFITEDTSGYVVVIRPLINHFSFEPFLREDVSLR